jgi:hypothetical protein
VLRGRYATLSAGISKNTNKFTGAYYAWHIA